ncbi:MAG: hypothetical protein P1U42_02975 [Phycisphaerales bacterium]|nr:hypothetical protein [Phycisphaerales bacterium]
MNQDIQKNFMIKLIGVSMVLAAIWFYFVGSQSKKLHSLTQQNVLQQNRVEQGEELISKYNSQVESSVAQMDEVRTKIFDQLSVEQEVNLHKLLQDSAESFGLTVARIEPLRTATSSNIEEDPEKMITLQTSEFRVECSGPYDGIVRYIEDISTSMNMAKVDSFRVIPVASDNARLILQASTYELTEYPTAIAASFDDSTDSGIGLGADNE